ncbi:MAG: hypothetical protein ABSE62_06635 [Chthoniobacteraceae bacterium]|jgi:hypothetical protein
MKLPGRYRRNAMFFLGLAVIAAWFPICRPYLRIGDDFHFAEWFLTGGIPIYFHEDGVWRILGHELGAAATLASPLLPGILAILTQGIAAILFLLVLRRLLVSDSLALLLAAIFAIYPWGDTALLWACGYTYLLATTFFMAVLCLLLRVFPLRDGWNLLLCAVCAAFSLFANETLFFALLISGGIVLLRDNGPLKRRLPLAAAPALGCCLWAALYKLYPGQIPAEHIKLHLRTLLSGIFYQYTNLEVFEPWRSGGTRALLFFDWSSWQFAAGAILFCALLLLWPRRSALASGTDSPRPSWDNRMLLFLLALVVASVAIYAIGGGFSLDSRKKYPIVPIVLLFLGYGAERFFPRLRIPDTAILAVVLCGIATTWLQIGLWRYETRRLDLLVDFLRAQPAPASVHINWDSRIQAAWPRADQFWGTPVEGWVIADALRLKALTSPPSRLPGRCSR